MSAYRVDLLSACRSIAGLMREIENDSNHSSAWRYWASVSLTAAITDIEDAISALDQSTTNTK